MMAQPRRRRTLVLWQSEPKPPVWHRRLQRWSTRLAPVLWALAAAVIICCGARQVAARWTAPSAERHLPAARVTVRSGDSLWGIVVRHYGRGGDTRQLVRFVRAANGLGPGQALQPGDHLFLPSTADPKAPLSATRLARR